MAVSITNNMSELYDAEATSSWSTDGGGVSTYSGFNREGSNCLGEQASLGAVNCYKTISSTNLSNVVIYSWLRSGNPGTTSQGGFRIVLGDGTNRRAYHVGGSDDYGFQFGAWSCFVLNTASLPATYSTLAGSSAPSLSAITQVGVGFYYPTKAVGTTDNVFWDICRYISNSSAALTIGGGGVSTQGTFAEIVAEDESTTNAYGIIRELQSGVYGVQGALEFGNSGTADSYFQDSNAVVVFEDRAVPTSYYDITLVGNSTGTNSFVLGEASGAVGINGCVIKCAGSSKCTFDLDDTNFDEVQFYGCTFDDCGTFACPTVDADKEFLSCNFLGCGVVTVSTCEFDYCNFVGSDGDSITVSSASFDVTNSSFIDPGDHAVELTSATTYTFDNLTFVGTDGSANYDIENTTAGSITVQNTNGADASNYENTGGGSTTIETAITITITVQDEATDPIENAQVAIYKTSDRTQIMNEDTTALGVASESYSGGAADIEIRVRKSSTGATKYIPYSTLGTTSTSNYDLLVTLKEDPNA